MENPKTVKVKTNDDYKIINEEDFDENVHEIYEDPNESKVEENIERQKNDLNFAPTDPTRDITKDSPGEHGEPVLNEQGSISLKGDTLATAQGGTFNDPENPAGVTSATEIQERADMKNLAFSRKDRQSMKKAELSQHARDRGIEVDDEKDSIRTINEKLDADYAAKGQAV